MQSRPRVVTGNAKAASSTGTAATPLAVPVTDVAGGKCEDPAGQPHAAGAPGGRTQQPPAGTGQGGNQVRLPC